ERETPLERLRRRVLMENRNLVRSLAGSGVPGDGQHAIVQVDLQFPRPDARHCREHRDGIEVLEDVHRRSEKHPWSGGLRGGRDIASLTRLQSLGLVGRHGWSPSPGYAGCAVTRLGLAASGLGSVKVRIPATYFASTRVPSNAAGSVTLRLNG